MRLVLVPVLLLTLAAASYANTIVDAFPGTSNCSYTTAPPYDGGCDVIGNIANYDIQKIDVTASAAWVSVKIYLNYGNNISGVSGTPLALNSFSDAGMTLKMGDLLFYDPSNPATVKYYDSYGNSTSFAKYLYGVPLMVHDNLAAGNLYQINYTADSTPLQTADDLLNGGNFRRDQPVWMDDPGAAATYDTTLAATGSGVTVAQVGDGTTAAKYSVTIGFVPTAAFISTFTSSGSLGIQFASAICANDIITGTTPFGGNVPEPASIALIAGGAALLLLSRRKMIKH
jgi:hypothetical protein